MSTVIRFGVEKDLLGAIDKRGAELEARVAELEAQLASGAGRAAGGGAGPRSDRDQYRISILVRALEEQETAREREVAALTKENEKLKYRVGIMAREIE
jgi:hypothetical protein